MRGRRQDLGLDVSTECDSWGNERDRRSKTHLKSCFRERRAMALSGEVSSLFPPLSIARWLLKAYRFEILKLIKVRVVSTNNSGNVCLLFRTGCEQDTWLLLSSVQNCDFERNIVL